MSIRTEEQASFVRQRFDAGESAGMIAAALGVSRNTICSFLHRNGMRRGAAARAMPSSRWTPEADAILRETYKKGLSASEIAARLGEGFTKSMVIGRADRLGLMTRRHVLSAAEVEAKRLEHNDRDRGHHRQQADQRPVRLRPKLPAPKPVVYRERPAPRIEDMVEPTSMGVSLIDLRTDQCKWPHGEPAKEGFGFCGHPRKWERPYCAYHLRLSYSPPRGNLERLGGA